jgi:hypothetical protein
MERMARRVRRTRMMDQRPLRGRAGFLGILGAGLLFAAVSGCGSVVASDSAAAPAAAAGATATAAPQVGCASVNQATAVSIRRLPHLMTPVDTKPADIGTEYLGTFYDGSRVLAAFAYAASGCERVSVTAAGKTLSTGVYGRAAAAAPHLATDLAVILGGPKPGTMQPQSSVNPGGPNMSA